jgi:hypothetical protein
LFENMKGRGRKDFRILEIVAADAKRLSEVAMWRKRKVNMAVWSGQAWLL